MEAKVAAVTPILRSDEKIDNRNYRPVSILNSISKILENVIKEQLVPYFDNFLSAFISAYRKTYSSQHVLVRMMKGIQFATCISQNDERHTVHISKK